MTPAIETVGLTKCYGSIRAVTDLELTVESGQVFGFLGPNGAGKTTTIRILLALQRPTGGHAQVLGLDAQRDSLEVHRRVGYLPGELALYPRLTGAEHLALFARARGEHTGRRSPPSWSSGSGWLSTAQRGSFRRATGRRSGWCSAFMHQPELLILDEPTSGLDPLMQDEFERLVREVASEGRTVFLSSHDLDEVQRGADRVAIIKAGRLIATDTVERLRQSAPQKVEAWFSQPVDPSTFAAIDGVTVTAADSRRVALEVTPARSARCCE